MALLSEAVTKAYFGAGEWKVVLLRKGKEISTPGYQPLDPSWAVAGSGAASQVRFAFDQFAKFDELAVTRDGIVVDREPMGGEVSLPPGAEWVHDITVTMSET